TPAGVRDRGDPAGASAPRRLPEPPAESEAAWNGNQQLGFNTFQNLRDFFSALVEAVGFF
ncbi:hypothetical protein J9303_10950, partial [Bacillaceae bacterium Marseille-Q3522]|nr:hypothetical protein [Bacillaceae bacterium Marseille-Q3522]